jgi:hypothetical protein
MGRWYWNVLSRAQWLETGLGLVIGFIWLLNLVTTINYNTIANSHTLRFTKIRNESYYHSLSLPSADWKLPLSIGRSVKLLLVFASTIIPGFSLLEIHDQDFYSLIDIYVYGNGASSSTEGSGFLLVCRLNVCCTRVSAVTASGSLWTLCCHCTRNTEIFCQCWFLQQVIPSEAVTLRLAVYRQSFPLGAKPHEYFNSCGHSPYVTSSLTRGWVCVLWICLAFVKCMYRTSGNTPAARTDNSVSFSCFVAVWSSRCHGPHRKHSFQQFFYCCVRNRGCCHVTFTRTLHSNGCLSWFC